MICKNVQINSIQNVKMFVVLVNIILLLGKTRPLLSLKWDLRAEIQTLTNQRAEAPPIIMISVGLPTYHRLHYQFPPRVVMRGLK
jgi:hypothetical protein